MQPCASEIHSAQKDKFSDENCLFYFAPCSSEHRGSPTSTLPCCWGNHTAPWYKGIRCCFMKKKMKWQLWTSVLFQSKSSLLNRFDGTEHGQSIFSIKTLRQSWSPAALDCMGQNPELLGAGSSWFLCACEHWSIWPPRCFVGHGSGSSATAHQHPSGS